MEELINEGLMPLPSGAGKSRPRVTAGVPAYTGPRAGTPDFGWLLARFGLASGWTTSDSHTVAEHGPGRRFLERSTHAAQSVWEHELAVEPAGGGVLQIWLTRCSGTGELPGLGALYSWPFPSCSATDIGGCGGGSAFRATRTGPRRLINTAERFGGGQLTAPASPVSAPELPDGVLTSPIPTSWRPCRHDRAADPCSRNPRQRWSFGWRTRREYRRFCAGRRPIGFRWHRATPVAGLSGGAAAVDSGIVLSTEDADGHHR